MLVVGRLDADAAEAAADSTAKPPAEPRIYQRFHSLLQLYQDDDNATLQSLAIVGRYHGQYASVDAEQGSADRWENRRIFVGMEARLYRHLVLHAQIALSDDLDPVYDHIYQLFAQWNWQEGFNLTVGRIDYVFLGLERSQSSNRIATFERGLLANQTLPNEVVGAILEDHRRAIGYRVGILSGTIDDEFSDFSGGLGIVAGVSHELPLFYSSGDLHLDYLYDDGNDANNALHLYDHQLSLWHQGQVGDFAMGTDLSWAHGLNGRPALFGVTLIPTYTFATDLLRRDDALQAVLRVQLAVSDGDNGLELQPRYERDVASGNGDRYRALYAGINYRIVNDRFKIMTGVERSSMHDSANDGGEFDGWTYLGGVRVFF